MKPAPHRHEIGQGPKRTQTVVRPRVIRIVPVGTMGKAISLAGTILGEFSKVVQQIETPRSPDPIVRRLRADREEKRVTRGAT